MNLHYNLYRHIIDVLNIINREVRFNNSSHQSIYSNIPATGSLRYLNISQTPGVQGFANETPLYSNVRELDSGGMTYGEQLIHNSRHGILAPGISK